jgi:hypothetical protein
MNIRIDDAEEPTDLGHNHLILEPRQPFHTVRLACNSVQGATAFLAFTAKPAMWNL